MASTAIATSLSPVIMMASCGAPPAVAAAECSPFMLGRYVLITSPARPPGTPRRWHDQGCF